MRHRTRLALLWLAVSVLACLAEPSDDTDPLGDPYGTYAIGGHLLENQCGEGVPALDPISFDVDLGRLGETSVWRQDGAPLAYGTVSSDGTWEVRQTVVQNVFDADPLTGAAACALTQTEVLRLKGPPLPPPGSGPMDAAAGDSSPLDGGVPGAGNVAAAGAETMEGSLEITFVPTAGSDCTPSLAAYGGPFAALPCSVRYELTAQRQD